MALEHIRDKRTGGATTFTCSGNNVLLACGVSRLNTAVTSATYNGVNLTQLLQLNDGVRWVSIWYLVNPDIGAYTFNIPVAGGYTVAEIVCVNGVNTADPINNTNSNSGTSQPKNISVTTDANNTYLLDSLGASSGTHTPASGQTDIASDLNYKVGYKIVSTSGSNAMNWNSTSSNLYIHIVTAFNEATEGSFLTF